MANSARESPSGACHHLSYESQGAGIQYAGPLRPVTRGMVSLRLCVTCRLTRCRCLPCLLASQTALTPSANPPGNPGLHHSHLPLLHERTMVSQAGRSAAPPADPRLVMPADVSAQAPSKFRPCARRTTPTVSPTRQSTLRAPLLGHITGEAGAPPRPEIWPGGLHRAPTASAGGAAVRAPCPQP